MEGNTFRFKAEVSTPLGKLNMEIDGTLDGGSITGNFKTPMGPMPYTGERQ